MTWAALTHAEFDAWLLALSSRNRVSVMAYLRMLGGSSARSTVACVRVAGAERRTAIVILGGDKTGDDRWYQVNVPLADRRFDAHPARLAARRAPGRRR